ncbi:MAG: hypothetical protein KVP17_002867 [Porospora cf. gigantea B]|uniref:uncharacterized protein n=1 Tax=Porospora cf. gigantea B TaxID=2853592 RepID=UPI0035718681|nr:MAG: hypothetical protein KVP17_002867 [Porospora cf. gigantea B]
MPRKSKKAEEENPLYDVEAIVGYKVENGKDLYLVKWMGYPTEDNTWEPRSCFPNMAEGIVAQMESLRAQYNEENHRSRHRETHRTKRMRKDSDYEPKPRRKGARPSVAYDTSSSSSDIEAVQPSSVVVLKVSRMQNEELMAVVDNCGTREQMPVSKLVERHSKALCQFLLKRVQFRTSSQ